MARYIRRQRNRRRRRHPPARLRGIRCRLPAQPQQDHGHVTALGRKRHAAAGRKVENAGIARQLDYHHAQCRTAQPIHPCAQHGSRIGQDADDHPGWIKPDRRQPGRMQSPCLSPRRLLDQPQRLSADQPHEHSGKTRTAGRIAALCQHLMQLPSRHPPAQRMIDARMPGCRKPRPRLPGPIAGFEQGNPAPDKAKRFGHMFLICSVGAECQRHTLLR